MSSKFNFKELMKERHSCRDFQSKEIPEETLKEIVKTASSKVEQAKVAIRNVREDARKSLKAAEELSEDVKKRAEKEIDDLTKEFNDKIDAAFKAKSDEIMKI